MKTSASLFLLGLLLVGCAKEKKYKEVYKENNFDKSLLSSDPNDPYVYVPSVENTPMNVTASRSYWVGEQKLVIFKFAEAQLEVLEIPSDKRFAANENNYSPVFKLPVSYKDYRCEKDEFNECKNKEEEVQDTSWDNKRFFNADFSKLTVLETNSLPEQLSNLFEKCFEDKGSVVKYLQMDSGSVNITVEKTITAGINCADLETLDDLRNITFKVNYHYSFVKLSQLAAQNYEPVNYPNADQNQFGFFTTTRKKLTADNLTTLDSDVTYLNRWNPNRGELVYHLNSEFYDEGMESVLAATYKAVDTINSSFKSAKVNLHITLADGRSKKMGDLRNNFLILVKDPQASGVIGYGPSIANPLTGEILKAQTVMYYGSIKKGIQDAYEELVSEARQRASNAETQAAELAAQVVKDGQLVTQAAAEMAEVQSADKDMQKHLLNLFNIKEVKDVVHTRINVPISNLNRNNLAVKLKSEIFSHARILKHHTIEDEVEEMSRHNMYHESMVNWNDAVGSAFTDGVIDLSTAQPWNSLSDSEKDVLIQKLMPYVWIPTLVHELGHNLGLRHNFNGSEDKMNYYSAEERASLGIERDITYSSVMDYAYSSLNQLSVMGKYDIAALRFGYNREIELKDGKIHQLTKTLEEHKQESLAIRRKDPKIKEEATFFGQLKEFQYCTDEHAAVNAGCNRFDEGSSLTAMAEHYIKSYKKYYEKRNRRNNRLNFTGGNDASYYSSIKNTFEGLRLFFESYDRIKGAYPSLTDADWESMEFLKDLKSATKMAADFYVDILKTPSVHCAVMNLKTDELEAILPIEDLSSDAISCFDEDSMGFDKTKYAVFGEIGKHINHARGPYLRGDIKADPSQLDIRGIWIDKVLAMKYLTMRELGSSTFDDYRSNFLDYSEFQAPILETFLSLMSDKIDSSAEITLATGKTVPFKQTYKVAASHDIKKSFSTTLNKVLGITKPSTDIRELVFPLVTRSLMTADDETTTQELLQKFQVVRVDPTTFVNTSSVAAYTNIKGMMFAAMHGNVLAKHLMNQRNVRVKLETFKRDKLIDIFNARVENKVPTEIPVDQKELYEIDMPIFRSYLAGELPADLLMQKLFTIMSR